MASQNHHTLQMFTLAAAAKVQLHNSRLQLFPTNNMLLLHPHCLCLGHQHHYRSIEHHMLILDWVNLRSHIAAQHPAGSRVQVAIVIVPSLSHLHNHAVQLLHWMKT